MLLPPISEPFPEVKYRKEVPGATMGLANNDLSWFFMNFSFCDDPWRPLEPTSSLTLRICDQSDTLTPLEALTHCCHQVQSPEPLPFL